MHPCLAEVSLDVVLPATLRVPLVMIAQTSVRNGADKRLRRFYHDPLGRVSNAKSPANHRGEWLLVQNSWFKIHEAG
jgi:hypothetical protein